jgi:hypothetical protein
MLGPKGKIGLCQASDREVEREKCVSREDCIRREQGRVGWAAVINSHSAVWGWGKASMLLTCHFWAISLEWDLDGQAGDMKEKGVTQAPGKHGAPLKSLSS